ncbi:hypothetical protein BJ138DRAFT_205582 [Hygrophoropsis aurantiaca]|uniref:Uncharacterized protein n=1 Tax=Hygrophoropsis aurantiaca TaxID=72124 RepID=A0ACB8A9C5_9AGAM|nr:hypothetical protein BJ138DRAFT_205582 [Hygrophoropsis aurantiaca]
MHPASAAAAACSIARLVATSSIIHIGCVVHPTFPTPWIMQASTPYRLGSWTRTYAVLPCFLIPGILYHVVATLIICGQDCCGGVSHRAPPQRKHIQEWRVQPGWRAHSLPRPPQYSVNHRMYKSKKCIGSTIKHRILCNGFSVSIT